MIRADLIKALKLVMPGAGKGETLLSGADSFVFSPGHVQTYNDNLSVSFPIATGIEGAVKAGELVRVLEKMSGIEVTLERDQDSALLITDGATDLSLKLLDINLADLIQALNLENLRWKKLPTDFLEAMELCLPCASSNPAQTVIRGIRVEGISVFSTDNFRASWYLLSATMDDFTIPKDSVADLLKIPDLTKYSVTSSWVHFTNDNGVIFSSRTLGGAYPSDTIRNLFPPEEEGELFTLPEALKSSMDRTQLVTYLRETGLDYVTISKEGNHLIVKGERDFGSIKDRIPIEPDQWPDGVAIHIHPKFLRSALDYSLNCRRHRERFLIMGADKFQHLVGVIAP